jgi:hypothetical protein
VAYEIAQLAGSAAAVVLGIGAILFGGRALSILRRPPTGETGRELVFLTAEDLVTPIALVLLLLFVEWVEWIVNALNAADVIALAQYTLYTNIVQGVLVFATAISLYRVFVPYTRPRRTKRAERILDRLAARVALLRGRK